MRTAGNTAGMFNKFKLLLEKVYHIIMFLRLSNKQPKKQKIHAYIKIIVVFFLKCVRPSNLMGKLIKLPSAEPYIG